MLNRPIFRRRRKIETIHRTITMFLDTLKSCLRLYYLFMVGNHPEVSRFYFVRVFSYFPLFRGTEKEGDQLSSSGIGNCLTTRTSTEEFITGSLFDINDVN